MYVVFDVLALSEITLGCQASPKDKFYCRSDGYI